MTKITTINDSPYNRYTVRNKSDRDRREKIERIIQQKKKIYEKIKNGKDKKEIYRLTKIYAHLNEQESFLLHPRKYGSKSSYNSFFKKYYPEIYKQYCEEYDDIPEVVKDWKDDIPKYIGNYKLEGLYTVDEVLNVSSDYRNEGYWVKVVNYDNISKDTEAYCAVYLSTWKKEEESEKGIPQWLK